MTMTYVSPDQTMKEIAKMMGYKGKYFRLSTSVPSSLDSYWDGGSRDYYFFYHLDQNNIVEVGSNHPIYEKNQPRTLEELPDRVILVKHTICCGKDLGLTFYAKESDMAHLLEQKTPELTDIEKSVLRLTSYRSDFRKEQMRAQRINQETYEQTKASLVEKGFLDKRGAVTITGRNVRNSL